MMLAGHHRTMASLIMNSAKTPQPRDPQPDDGVKEERTPNSWQGISVEDAREQVLGGGLATKRAGKKGFWGTRPEKRG